MKFTYWHLILEVNPKLKGETARIGDCLGGDHKTEEWMTLSKKEKDFIWSFKTKYLMRLPKELSPAQVGKKLKARADALGLFCLCLNKKKQIFPSMHREISPLLCLNNKKRKKSYKNDDMIFMIDKWFETHTALTKENYEMLNGMVYHFRCERQRR